MKGGIISCGAAGLLHEHSAHLSPDQSQRNTYRQAIQEYHRSKVGQTMCSRSFSTNFLVLLSFLLPAAVVEITICIIPDLLLYSCSMLMKILDSSANAAHLFLLMRCERGYRLIRSAIFIPTNTKILKVPSFFSTLAIVRQCLLLCFMTRPSTSIGKTLHSGLPKFVLS